MGAGTSWQWRILFLMVFCWNLCSTSTDYDLLDSEELLPTTTSEPLPYFEDHANLTNITAPLGSTAFLHCKVNLLKDKTCKALLTMYQRIAAHGKVDRLRFREILHTTFDITDDVMLDRVYRVFDTSNDGIIDEVEWVEGISILCRGTPEQLIDFCYNTYDINGDKSLAREELHHCLKNSLYPHAGVLNNDEIEEGLREIVEILMKKLDVDKDGQITESDFRTACFTDPLLLQSIGPCLPPAKSLAAFMATFTENYRSYSSEWSEWKVQKNSKAQTPAATTTANQEKNKQSISTTSLQPHESFNVSI